MMESSEFLSEIERNKGIILKIVSLYADDQDDKNDMQQEIIFQAWKSVKRFKGESKFSTWLYSISLNVAMSFLRKQRKFREIIHPDLSDLIETQPEVSERSEKLYSAIRMLSEVDRGVIILHLDSYDNTEIAEMTGISINYVAVKLHRIKLELTKLLKTKK